MKLVRFGPRDHAIEAGMPIPTEPIAFMKATSCISGPHDPIRLPPGSVKTDWEVGLGIGIGREARHVTKDEVPAPRNLELWLELNGERVQGGRTATMIFGCAEIVSYLSRFMTLLPGDVIATGTPPGVGMGMKPPRFIKAGDMLRLGVTPLTERRQGVKSSEGSIILELSQWIPARPSTNSPHSPRKPACASSACWSRPDRKA